MGWHSARQTLTALSTAESEIIAAVDSTVHARAISPLWSELCRSDLLWSQWFDNSACVQLLLVPAGAWRTRHLRLRARHFRDVIADESLAIQNMPGVELRHLFLKLACSSCWSCRAMFGRPRMCRRMFKRMTVKVHFVCCPVKLCLSHTHDANTTSSAHLDAFASRRTPKPELSK